jgi:hypothetical protein
VNALANTVVTASVPNYVQYLGQVSPSGENVTYDSRTGTVSWNVGDISEHQSRTVSFSLGLTASLSQVGTAPTVLSGQTATGFDRYVQDNVTGSAPDLNTLSASPSYSQANVVQ